MKRNGLVQVGAWIFLLTGIFYALGRWLKNKGLFWLLGKITSDNAAVAGVGSFLRVFIYIAAVVYILIALYGFFSGRYANATGLMIIGAIAVLWGVVGLFRHGFALLSCLQIAGGICYLSPAWMGKRS